MEEICSGLLFPEGIPPRPPKGPGLRPPRGDPFRPEAHPRTPQGPAIEGSPRSPQGPTGPGGPRDPWPSEEEWHTGTRNLIDLLKRLKNTQ